MQPVWLPLLSRPRSILSAARNVGLALVLVVFPARSESSTNESKPLLGFSPAASASERALEIKFDSFIQKDNLRDWMKRLSARPHHLGSANGKAVAEFIADKFQSWGFETQIERFDVLFPTPIVRKVEMTLPERFSAGLSEPPIEADSTSGLVQEQLPTFNAYSIDGDVTAELVYVNYGIPKDYETLEERGISVKGKIVIARYGASWRGIKPKVAAEHGAVACLIYSDPHEEGYAEGDVYPQGAWRNENGVERGSVADMPVYPGDPLTPGVGATKDAKRLSLNEATTLTRIPVLPISYHDALPLLKALNGPVAPEGWRGSLPITYHIGPGAATVHVQLQFDWRQVPAYDVIARLPGSERPDEWIIRGNHHDAWVCGAEDPLSGTVALLEEARVMSELAKTGWKPKRSILYCVWDGEEPGLLGSTEWVETHAAELQHHAAVYVNSDNNARGFLWVGGSHSLEKLVNEVALDVVDPEMKVSVAARTRARLMATGNAEERRQIREHSEFRIRALGSGSDYTPFLQHLGIASLDIRYAGEGEGGSYHSIYDSFDHYTRFIDPSFEYGVALAQTAGRTVLRLANAESLPFEFTAFADTVSRYASELAKLVDDMRDETKESNRLISEKVFELSADPTQPFLPPRPKTPVPYFNFAPLQNAVEHVRENARQLDARILHSHRTPAHPSTEASEELDSILMKLERILTRESGLPRRPWYRHMIYAPGFYTGYGVKTLPAIREAIEERQWEEINDQIEMVARILERYAEELAKAIRLAGSAEPSGQASAVHNP